MRSKSLKGFTLIELLIVIVIIGILAAGAVTLFSGAQGKARDAKRKADLQAFATSVQLYAADNNSQLPSKGTFAEVDDVLVGAKVLQKQAVAPKGVGNETYCYYYNATGEYVVAAYLEDANITTPASKVYSVGNNVVWASPAATDFITTCPAQTGFTDEVLGAD